MSDNISAPKNQTEGIQTPTGFRSPNIVSLVEQSERSKPTAAPRAPAHSESERVDIDGIPIPQNEQQFRSEDIRYKVQPQYFTRLTGVEEYERKKQRMARKEAVTKRQQQLISDFIQWLNAGNWKWLVIAFVVLTITVVGIVLLLTAINDGTSEAPETPAASVSEEVDENGYYVDAPEIRPEANIISSDDVEAGIAEYDRLIETADSDLARAGFFYDRARELYAIDAILYAGQILMDAHSAYVLYPTATNALIVADYEAELGLPENAEYYRNIAERLEEMTE